MTITETLREKIGAPSIPDESVDETAAILTQKILKYPCTDDEIGDTGDDVVSNIFKSVPKLNDLSVEDQKIVYDIVVRNLKKDEKNKIDKDHHKLLEEVKKITEKKRQKLLEEVKRIMTEKIDKRYSHEKIMALFLDTIKGKRPQSGKASFTGLVSKPRASLVSDSARMSQNSRASERSQKSQTARKSSSRRSQSSSRRSQTRHSRTSIPSNHASKSTHSRKTATTLRGTDSIYHGKGGEATPRTLPTNTRPSQAGRHSLTAHAAKRVSKSKRPSSSQIEIQKRATAGTEDEETENEATSLPMIDGGTQALHDEETHKAQGGQRKSESMKGKPKDDKEDEDVEDDEDDEDDEGEDEDGEEDDE